MKAGRCSGAEVVDARVSILTPAQDLPERIRRGPADVLNLVLERFRQVRNGAGHDAADQCTEPTGVAINVLCISYSPALSLSSPFTHAPNGPLAFDVLVTCLVAVTVVRSPFCRDVSVTCRTAT